jgi:hypothetical protein
MLRTYFKWKFYFYCTLKVFKFPCNVIIKIKFTEFDCISPITKRYGKHWIKICVFCGKMCRLYYIFLLIIDEWILYAGLD